MPYPHMPASGLPGNYSVFPVTYTGTGAEGTDFVVPIGATMSSTAYGVFSQSAGGTSGDGSQTSGVEVVDMPIASRTTTAFRVVLGSALAAGDTLQFLINGMVSS